MKTLIKISGILILTVLLLGLLVPVIIQQYGPAYVQKRLAKKVRTVTKNRYRLSIDSLVIDPWTVSLRLVRLRFDRDTLSDHLSGIHVLDEYDVRVTLDEFLVEDFDLLRLLKGGDLDLNRIRLSGPSIRIQKIINYEATQRAAEGIEADSSEFKVFSDSAARHIPVIEISSFSLENASFAFYDGKNENPELEVKGLSAGLSGFHSKNIYPVLSAAPYIKVDTLSMPASKGIARLSATGLTMNDTTLHLDNIHYRHVIAPHQINNIKGFRANWLDFKGHDLDIHGIDYRLAADDSVLALRHIELGEFSLLLFKDKADSRINPAYKALPSKLIRNIPIPFEIDTLQLSQGYLDIQMEAETGNRPGRLVISDINAHISPLTNLPERLALNPFLDLHIKARMMDRGPVDLQGRIQVDSPEDYYEMRVSVGAMPLNSLNHFLGSQFLFEFTSGELQNMQLEYTGNNRYTKGTMGLEYTNLKIRKLKNFKQFRATQPNNGFLLSLANWIIPNDRRRDQRSYKTGIVYYEKPLNRDIVHVLVQSMLSGVVSNFGFGPASIETVEKRAAKLKDKPPKIDG